MPDQVDQSTAERSCIRGHLNCENHALRCPRVPGVVCTVVPASGSRSSLHPSPEERVGAGLPRLPDIHHQEFVTGRVSDCYHRCYHRCQEVVAVAALNIRNLNETVKRRLQVRAARHGRSMEAEVRAILEEAVREPADSAGLFQALLDRFGALGGSTWTCPDATNRRAPRSLRMIILDTNVVSELMRPEPAPQVASWFETGTGASYAPRPSRSQRSGTALPGCRTDAGSRSCSPQPTISSRPSKTRSCRSTSQPQKTTPSSPAAASEPGNPSPASTR